MKLALSIGATAFLLAALVVLGVSLVPLWRAACAGVLLGAAAVCVLLVGMDR